MNLPSEALAAFLAPENSVTPFEFRSLTGEDVAAAVNWVGLANGGNGYGRAEAGRDCAAREMALRKAVDAAKLEGMQLGEREGRRAARAEMDAEVLALVAEERARLVGAVEQFRAARDRYFV
jgi:hypothetical protein